MCRTCTVDGASYARSTSGAELRATRSRERQSDDEQEQSGDRQHGRGAIALGQRARKGDAGRLSHEQDRGEQREAAPRCVGAICVALTCSVLCSM